MTEEENSDKEMTEEVQREIPETLALPVKMRVLLDFVLSLDQSLNLLHHRQTVATFTNIKNFVERDVVRTFTMSHFKQIIFVAPFLYNHSWELKHGKMEAIIGVPSNYDAILRDNSVSASQDNHYGILPGSIMHQRKNLFKKLLQERCVSDYTAWR